MSVLGAISVSNISKMSTSDMENNCFTVENSEKDEWHLCAGDKTQLS